MLTVSYSLEIPRDDFFYSESGEVREEMEAHALRCASCGKWLYMPGKEDLSGAFKMHTGAQKKYVRWADGCSACE